MRIKREKKIGYKIVWNDFPVVDNIPLVPRFISAIIRGEPAIKYEFNKRVFKHVNHGPLAVFNTLEEAIDFIRPEHATYEAPYYKIFTCEYRESIYKKLWYGEKYHIKRKLLPPGTRFADNLKLTKFMMSGDEIK